MGASLPDTPRRTPSSAGGSDSIAPLLWRFVIFAKVFKSKVHKITCSPKSRWHVETPSPNGPTSRVAVESVTGTGCLTRLGPSKRVVVMAEAHLSDLVIFLSRNSSTVCAKMVGPERVSPRRTRLLSKRPWSLGPAAGHPETNSSRGYALPGQAKES